MFLIITYLIKSEKTGHNFPNVKEKSCKHYELNYMVQVLCIPVTQKKKFPESLKKITRNGKSKTTVYSLFLEGQRDLQGGGGHLTPLATELSQPTALTYLPQNSLMITYPPFNIFINIPISPLIKQIFN